MTAAGSPLSRAGIFVMEGVMTATTLLYHHDPRLLTFDGLVSAIEVDAAGRHVVVLRETAFYPEAGGQMADPGVLGGARVSDVQVGDDGVVRHVVEAGFTGAVGDVVAGVVDGARRRQHMAMHTAQHVLSQVLLQQRAGAETVSARLGETVCTVDVDVAASEESSLSTFDDDEAVTSSPLLSQCDGFELSDGSLLNESELARESSERPLTLVS